ncbi:Rv1733c family protein [Streptomyces sp. 7R007]
MARAQGRGGWTWRRRRNPLRRRSDVVEAWIIVAAWVITLAGSPFAGLTTADAVARDLERQRAETRTVSAALIENAVGTTSAQAVDDTHVWAAVRWTAPDGSAHTGRTEVPPGTPMGTSVTIWTDRRGRLVAKPPTSGEAELHGLVRRGGCRGYGRCRPRRRLSRARLDGAAPAAGVGRGMGAHLQSVGPKDRLRGRGHRQTRDPSHLRTDPAHQTTSCAQKPHELSGTPCCSARCTCTGRCRNREQCRRLGGRGRWW